MSLPLYVVHQILTGCEEVLSTHIMYRVLDRLIRKPNFSLYTLQLYACHYKDLDLLKAIKTTDTDNCWDTTFNIGCHYGRTDLIDYALYIQLPDSTIYTDPIQAYERGLKIALDAKRQDAIKYLLDKPLILIKISSHSILLMAACYVNNIDIAHKVIEDLNDSLKKYIFSRLPTGNDYTSHVWNIGLYGACMGGHLKLVETMIKLGANDFNKCRNVAKENGHIHILDYFDLHHHSSKK